MHVPTDFRLVEVPTRTLYLLPMVLGLVGGVAGWVLTRRRDRRMSRLILALGATTTVLAAGLLGALVAAGR